MTLDTGGRLLEGIRVSSGNNSLTFPPRNYISDSIVFNVPTTRAEYAIIADSLDPNKYELDIADPDLIFRITKNESVAVRFDYDNFGRRFFPMPGSTPSRIGVIANSPRLSIPPPDLSLTSAPVSVYIGTTTRAITFNIVGVPTETDFTAPPGPVAGTVEVSEADGKLNFSDIDINQYRYQIIYATRQTFFDRKQSTGKIGDLPQSSSIDYFLFMNPKPATGQHPLIKIDYQRYLTPIEVPDESSLGSPAIGTFTWSLDTGRIRFAVDDVTVNINRPIYYDGVFTKSIQLNRTVVGLIGNSYPIPSFTIPAAIGNTDPNRFIIAAESGITRSYFPVTIIDMTDPPFKSPPPGTVYFDPATGAIYLRYADAIAYVAWNFLYVDTIIQIEDGVSIQFYRSGANGSYAPLAPDFTIIYEVTDQVIESKISASPFLMLPTTPIIDSFLNYKVAPGISSYFSAGTGGPTGFDLVDGTDSTKTGFGYLFDLDHHLFKFSNRKTSSQVVLKPTPIIKLDDAAISEYGFEISKNGLLMFRSGSVPGGSSLTPGIDFVFNSSNGTIEFIGSVGENDPINILGITGAVTLLNRFVSNESIFISSHTGKYLLVSSGDNVGIYHIEGIISDKIARVSPSFMSTGNTTADLKADVEIITDRFWTEFLPPYKKFTLMKANGSSLFSIIDNSQFSILKTTGQVNLNTQTRPNDVFHISYISLDSTDGGVTTTPTNRTETALFKVRQETATAAPDPTPVNVPLKIPALGSMPRSLFLGMKESQPVTGPRVFTFNPDGRTISTTKSINVYIGGMPLDASEFIYKAPNTIELSTPIQPGQTVVLDYWVEESTGGDNNFDLLYTPVDIDTPEIISGQQTAIFNGNQTSILSAGSAILIRNVEVIIIESVSYDSSNDVTNVKFETIPTNNSSGASLQATGPINGPYRIVETNSIDVFSKNTTTIYISGDKSAYYPSGTVVTVNNDPFLVRSSRYNSDNSKTEVMVTTSAKKNYIIPILTRTIRPITFPSSNFETEKPIDIDFPFTLVLMGNTRSILVNRVDYTISEGGIIKLSADVKFGDSLYIIYVYRENQPGFTNFTFNYAYQIAPDIDVNGIQGQQLKATYHLYAPDSFFYRVETIETFIPEVQKLLEASVGSMASGPNIANASSMVTKDYGSPSPYFEEQHQYNIDVTVIRLLKHYNDTINIYEDILSNLDGRVIGGNNGKFRFDGNLDNPPIDNYYQITNDIDDRIKLFDRLVLTGFVTFNSVPVYARMGEPNKLSRLFPTFRTVTAGVNDLTSFLHFGATMGSLGFENINKVLQITSSQGRSFFEVVYGGVAFKVLTNGDPDRLVPPLEINQKATVYAYDGTPDVSGTILDVIGDIVTLDTATTLTAGSILRNINIDDGSDSTLSYYVDGKDLNVDFDNGQINNFSLPPPFNIPQTSIKGDELLDVLIRYNNQNVDPARIPVLDGLELNDDGRVPAPLLKRVSESFLLTRELANLSQIGTAIVATNRIDIISNVPVNVGYQIEFLNGPNAGQIRQVDTISDPTHSKVSAQFSVADPISRDCRIYPNTGDQLDSIWNQEVLVIDSNVNGPIPPLAQLPQIDSEIKSSDDSILNSGGQVVSGTGNTTSTTILNDPTATFTQDGVDNGCLLFASSGNNHGLYKIDSVTANDITIIGDTPYAEFPAIGSTPYIIIRPYSFMSSRGSEFVTEFLRETISFLNSTQAFISFHTDSGKAARMIAISDRQAKITTFKDNLSGILTNSDRLYDARYLWIQQRTNREYGSLVRKVRAELTRQTSLTQIAANQQKLLIVKSL